MNFEKVYGEYQIYARSRHKKQGFITIDRDFNNHILPYFKNMNINEISKKNLVEWQNIILSKNFSNKYNAMLYYSFNSFMKYCVICSYVNENIVSSVGTFKKKIEYKEHKTYNIWQFRKFRFHIDNYIIKEYFNFIFFNGTRPGETMALKFSDLEGNFIHIRHNMIRKGKRELDTPKNQSSLRFIRISLLTKLRILLLRYYYIKVYGTSNYDYFIFGGIKPLAPTTIDRYKNKACIKANLFEITQHEFRHSYATRMIKNKPINYVSKSMGHSRISTTLDIYVH